MGKGTSFHVVTASGYTLSAPFLAFAFHFVPAVGFGRVPSVGLLGLALRSICNGGAVLGRSAKEAEFLGRRFSRYLFCHLLSSSWLNDCRVFIPIGLGFLELFTADTEVFFEESGVAEVCLIDGNSDVAYDRSETNNGCYGLVTEHPVVQPRWDAK